MTLAERTLGWLAIALAIGTPSVASADDVIGVPMTYTIKQEDTLMDVARAYDIGYVAIRSANPGVDPWLPKPGTLVTLPTQHILPEAKHRGIVINLPELRLYYYASPDQPPLSFPLGIGGEGKETPVGSTTVKRKQPHPQWVPTASEHAENPDLPRRVPPGPNNPMGEYALYLGWSGYAIHGTNKPDSIGRRDSHGCIRMYPEDIATLFRLVPVGTPVTVVNQTAKVGWAGDHLLLEVHPPEEDVDALETTGQPLSSTGIDADDLVTAVAGSSESRIDWYAVHLAEGGRTGVATPILLPPGMP